MKNTNSALTGSTAILVSAVFYASYGVWTKFMAGFFGEFNQAWIRAIIALAFLVPLGLLTKGFVPIKKQDWKWFAVIALAGGLNQAPYFYGYSHLEVGTGTLLFYVMLVLGSFLIGKFFFGEKLTVIKYVSLALGMVGLAIIYRFVLSPAQIGPALAIMLAGLMGATGIVFTKKLSGHYSETQILVSYFLVMLPTNLLLSNFLGEKIPEIIVSTAWLSLLGYFVSHLAANALAIVGFKYLEPAIAGLLGLTEVVFAAVLGALIFGEVITLNLILGSIFILLAAALPDAVKLFAAKK